MQNMKILRRKKVLLFSLPNAKPLFISKKCYLKSTLLFKKWENSTAKYPSTKHRLQILSMLFELRDDQLSVGF